MKLERYLQTEFQNVTLFEDSFVGKELSIRLELEKNLYQLKDGSDDINFDYFHSVYEKSIALFEDIFREEEQFYLVTHVRSELNFAQKTATKVFHHLKHKNDKYKMEYKKKVINEEEKIIQYAVLLPSKDALDYRMLIKAICNQDFKDLQPRLRHKYTYYPEVFFVNVDRNIILNIFDDRGCFVLFSDEGELNDFRNVYKDDIFDDTY
jgi:hypothetical protein